MYEKPPSPKDNKDVEGEGFVIKREEKFPPIHRYAPGEGTPVEFRPGESTDAVKQRKEKAWQEELQADAERTKGFTSADHAEDMLRNMLETHNPYSETFRIKPDGTFDEMIRMDGKLVYLGFAKTPQELYQIAEEIQKKHSEYKFNFETDPEGKWMKYTVSRDIKA
jgi:hypothetical protein